jgi:hypothetical protein
METRIEFTGHTHRAILAGEKAGAVCSWCGTTLPKDYYLLLSAWRSETKELVSPVMRFCAECWKRIETKVYRQGRQLKMPILLKEPRGE